MSSKIIGTFLARELIQAISLQWHGVNACSPLTGRDSHAMQQGRVWKSTYCSLIHQPTLASSSHHETRLRLVLQSNPSGASNARKEPRSKESRCPPKKFRTDVWPSVSDQAPGPRIRLFVSIQRVCAWQVKQDESSCLKSSPPSSPKMKNYSVEFPQMKGSRIMKY
jgi:hypothetical protein